MRFGDKPTHCGLPWGEMLQCMRRSGLQRPGWLAAGHIRAPTQIWKEA